MPVEVWLRRDGARMLPANTQGEEALQGLPADRWLLCSIRQPRNVKHHRKYMALLQAIFPHQDTWPTFTSFRKAFACALGHGQVVTSRKGDKILDADSISFAAMDQDEFNQFYARAVKLIHEKIVPGIDCRDLEREVEEIMAGREPQRLGETV